MSIVTTQNIRPKQGRLAGRRIPAYDPKCLPPAPPADQAGSPSQVQLLEFCLRGAYMKQYRTLLSVIVVALLFAMAANAQTYNPLYTYPQTTGGNTGILPPDAMSQGQGC